MEYFLSIGGERSGPCTQFRIIERIREGTLNGTELAWHKGAPQWQPLRDLQEFIPYWPLTAEQLAQADEARRIARRELDRPQPWLRFWARGVDYVWFNTMVLMIISPLLPPDMVMHPTASTQVASFLISIFIYLAFAPVEAWCLSRYGTTPGKSLLRIQIRQQDGSLPTYRQALRRGLLVTIRGIALGTFVAFFTMSYARYRLIQTGVTSWDRDCQTRVEHGEPELWRFLLLTGLMLLMIGAVMIGLVLMNSHDFMEALRSNLPK